MLVVSSAAGLVSGLALGAACLAVLLSLQASWLAMREPPTLRAYLDRLTAGGDAAWRDEFERPLRDYIRRHQDAARARDAGQP